MLSVVYRSSMLLIVVVFLASCGGKLLGQVTEGTETAAARETKVLEQRAGPYRRVFVRDTELPLEGYEAMELAAFQKMLEDREKRNAQKDPNSPTHETELRSFHAVARLSGADLVSDRARLRWSWDPTSERQASNSRRSIAPWSPAIAGTSQGGVVNPLNTLAPPVWGYDRNGLPTLRVSSQEDWFSWTLRPQANSTPNRLNYTLSFPRTIDGCLVMQLPKSARVIDSNIVIRAADNWNQVAERLRDWPVVLGASEGIPEWNATDSIWLLELSGRDQASFSVVLNPSRGQYDPIGPTDRSAPTLNRLIAKQTMVHSVSPYQIKTLCEWEWIETTTSDRTFRVRIPEGMRLRNVRLNEREAALQFSDRVLEIILPLEESSGSGAGPSSRTKVSAEFLSNLNELESDGTFNLPPIQCLNGYVVSGVTTIASDPSIELRNVDLEPGRLETLTRQDNVPERLNYSWYESPPGVSFQLSRLPVNPTAELLTKLSTDTNGAIAIIKMQLSPWHPNSPNQIQIDRSWSVETMQLNHRGLVLSMEESSPGRAVSLRIDSNGPVDEGNIQLELQLASSMNETLDGKIQSERLTNLPGRTCSEVLVVEPAYASRLEYFGDYAYDLCEEESLTPWQRDRLPRLGKFLLFRMPGGALPKLRWKKDPALFECSIASTLRDRGDHIEVEHRFDLDYGNQNPQNIDVQLPGKWRWEWASPEGWKVFMAERGENAISWELQHPDLRGSRPAADDSPAMHARFRAIGSIGKSEAPSNVPVPHLSSARAVQYTLRADPNLQIAPDQTRGVWKFDERGDLILQWQDPIPNIAALQIAVESNDQTARNRWWITQSDLHIAVDAHGQQRAVLEADAQGLRNEMWEFGLKLPQGWVLERILDQSVQREPSLSKDSFTFRADGKGYLISRQPAELDSQSCSLRMSFILSGPNLQPEKFLEWGCIPIQGLPYSWPAIDIDLPISNTTETLWLPNSITLVNPAVSRWDWGSWNSQSLPKVDGTWSAWRWTAEAASWIGWPAGKASASIVENNSHIPPRELIPECIGSEWQRVETITGESLNAVNRSQVWVLRSKSSNAGPTLWLVVSVLYAITMLRKFPWICLFIATAAACGGHWLPEPLAIWFRSTWVGFSLGAFAYLIWWTATSSGIHPADREQRQEPWQPWNEPGLSNDEMSGPPGRAVVATSICLTLSMALSLPMLAQDTISPAPSVGGDSVFDVLIPIQEDGTVNEGVVYVPSSIASRQSNEPSTILSIDRESYLVSARHNLRFDGRSISFGNTEQPCTHTYEVWIGEGGVGRPLRIPFSADQSRLNRFLVDGLEVTSSRLVRSDTELSWYPERPGRRTLQIESQVRIRPVERDKSGNLAGNNSLNESRSSRAWSVDTPILPAANAILEVETDAGWTVEFNRRGRYSNPSLGKFNIHLGSQDRLSGEIAPDAISSARGSGAIASDTGTLGVAESPQMNTELFIDRGQLLARTIVEYPRNVDAPEEIELESDLQWQPIGNLWGDAQLVDIRPGSTLDRRRYIARWTADASGLSGKRVVTTTWVPAGSSNLRNILFAECRDRRVRPNTLRYARSAGSVWTLEGINTWVPSINTKERIEWAELNERPIATSLRVPINGGFGVLRQQTENKLQRARVTHQWGVASSRILVRSRVEFANAINNRKSVVLSLPREYSVTEVLSRNASLAHAEWIAGDLRHLQIFVDRDIGDVSELLIIAEQDVAELEDLQPAPPYLAMDGIAIAEQFADLSADPAWRVHLQSDSLRGRGLGKPLASMSLLDGTEHDPSHDSIRIERLRGAWKGSLSVDVVSTAESPSRWRLRMIDNPSVDAKPTFAISLPAEICREWSGEGVARELPSLDPVRRLIQIQPRWTDDQKLASFDIEWLADPKSLEDPQWLERVRIESNPELILAAQGRENPDSNSSNPDQPTEGGTPSDSGIAQPIAGQECFEVHALVPDSPGPGLVSVKSSIWIDLNRGSPGNHTALQWSLPRGAQVDWANINGQASPWRQDGDKLWLVMPSLGIPLRIDLWVRVESSNQGLSNANEVPSLDPTLGLHRSGWIAQGEVIRELGGDRLIDRFDLSREICRHNLEVLAALDRPVLDEEKRLQVSRGLWHRWKEALSTETLALLIDLVDNEWSVQSGDIDSMISSYLDVSIEGAPRYRSTLRPDRHAIGEGNRENLFPEWERGMATVWMGSLAVLYGLIWRRFGKSLQRKSWWPLALLGAGIWVVFGTWIPALVLTTFGLLLALDSYLILNERFRQTATRAPR